MVSLTTKEYREFLSYQRNGLNDHINELVVHNSEKHEDESHRAILAYRDNYHKSKKKVNPTLLKKSIIDER